MDDGTKLFTENVLYVLWPQEGECDQTWLLASSVMPTHINNMSVKLETIYRYYRKLWFCLVPASKKSPPSTFNRLMSIALDHMWWRYWRDWSWPTSDHRWKHVLTRTRTTGRWSLCFYSPSTQTFSTTSVHVTRTNTHKYNWMDVLVTGAPSDGFVETSGGNHQLLWWRSTWASNLTICWNGRPT